MKRPLYLAALIALAALSGCTTMRTDGSRLTYAEWQEKMRLEAEAKKRGVPFTYKTKAQVRKEAEEMRDIATEVMNGAVKQDETKQP